MPDAPLDTASVCYWLCTVPLTKCMLLVMHSPLDTASVCYWLCTVPLTQQVYVTGYAQSP